MNKRIQIKDLLKQAGKVASLSGFVEKIRDQKSIQFVIIRDKSGRVQVTVFKPDLPEIAEQFTSITVGSVVEITGKVVAAPNVKLGGIEIVPQTVTVLSLAKLSPIDDQTGPDLAMDYRWIDLRSDKNQAIFKVMTIGEMAFREWFIKNDFTECHTPKITAFPSEGGAEVFEVKYYGQKAYLTQSPQLFKQMAMAAGFEKFFEIGSQYRAEKSYTNRHASESFYCDFEISYIRDHHEVMDTLESAIKHVHKVVEKQCKDILRDQIGVDFKAQTTKFPRITLAESYALLKKERNYDVPRASKGDLDPEGERLLCEIAKEKWNSDFIFITDFPAQVRAFYSMRHDGDSTLCKSFDLLYKGLEITSGAQREHNPDRLRENLVAKGINPKDMEFYVQFFEYGCPPHGGVGFGLQRFFARLMDQPAIRDTTFLQRSPDRLAP
ncbi:MAG: aspartate--tRNA(Asn) ligase [Firmicutes bacterium]|nr:aspartate--tRNA(Asn) ligase [Bacillota bacterium]